MMRFPPSDSHLFVGFAAEAETATFTGGRRQAEAVGIFFEKKKTDPLKKSALATKLIYL